MLNRRADPAVIQPKKISNIGLNRAKLVIPGWLRLFCKPINLSNHYNRERVHIEPSRGGT